MTTSRKWVLAATVVVLLTLLNYFVVRWWMGRGAASAPGGPAQTLDLTQFINAQLDQQWNTTTYPGDDLAELPRGVNEFDGVRFDVRGVVQLLGRVWKERGCPFPDRVEGIPIKRACRHVYLLHADGGASAPTGTTVAWVVLKYSDGTKAELPVQHGVHVKDWWSYGKPPPSDPNTVVAWTGQNKATARMGNSIRLYKTRFDNPHPARRVETLDYVSAMEAPGPFMVALTVE